jgi:hypothetical protein
MNLAPLSRTVHLVVTVWRIDAMSTQARKGSYALCKMPVSRGSPELKTHARATADSS